jgi:uncharacterized membrane protein
MDTFFGLPAHPLIVHIPVAMLPLAAIGVALMLIKHAWYERYKWAVLVVGGIGTVGAIIATSTGEGLERLMREQDGADAVRAVHEHVEAGDLARTLAIVFFVALAAWVLVPWYLERRSAAAADGDARAITMPSWVQPAMKVAVALTAVASMVSITNAGHSGATKAWEKYDTSVVAAP